MFLMIAKSPSGTVRAFLTANLADWPVEPLIRQLLRNRLYLLYSLLKYLEATGQKLAKTGPVRAGKAVPKSSTGNSPRFKTWF